MRKIDKIILHCSDSDIKAHDDIKVIREWHKARNFSDVGYHYFIRKDGTIQKGRNWEKIGAHCKGQNKASIGICLSGRHKFTTRQFEALEHTLERLTDAFSELPVHGHYEFSEKTCPNFDVSTFMGEYYDKIYGNY